MDMDIFKLTFKVILLFGPITIVFSSIVQQIYIKDNKIPVKGGDIQIVCEVSQFTNDVVRVYKTDTLPQDITTATPITQCIPSQCIGNIPRHTFSPSSSGVTITITNLNRSEDQKYWTCAINNQGRKYMQLTVYTITPLLQYDNPPSQNQDLVQNAVLFNCSTGCAFPSPNFTWYYNKTSGSRQEWSTTAPVTDWTGGCTDSEKRYTSTLTLSRYTQFTDNTDTTVKFQCGAMSITGAEDQLLTPASVNVRFAVRVSTVTLKDGSSAPANPLEVNSGEPHTLICTSSVSRPTATIIWYFGGQEQKRETTNTSRFIFTPEYSDNQKQVYCKAFNIQQESQAVSSKIVSLYVKVKVANVTLKDGNFEPSGTLEVTNGVSKTLTCTASESRPTATIIWYIGDDEKKRENVTLSTFTFTPVISDHNKHVYCKASQSGNPDVFSNRITLYVKVLATTPTITDLTTEKLEGDQIKYQCTSSITRPVGMVTWKLGTQTLTDVQNTDHSHGNDLKSVTSIVTFTANKTDNNKTIHCETAIPGQSNLVKAQVKITVYWPPVSPVISTSSFPFLEGQTGKSIYCSSSDYGNPTATAIWATQYGTPDVADARKLTLPKLTYQVDRSPVKCQLKNPFTQTKGLQIQSKQVLLQVEYSPRIQILADGKQVTTITKNEGQTLSVTCITTGNPTPIASWLGQQSSGPTLSFDDIDRADHGNYTCRATATSSHYPNHDFVTEEELAVVVNLDSPSVVPELRFIETPLTKGPFKIIYQPYIQFRCVFSNSSKYFYSVQWIIDGREIATLGPSQDIDELTLQEENFRDIPLGYTVQCSVTVSAAKLGQQTQTLYSDNFYAGVKVYNSTVFLKKGSHTHIAVSSTLPIGCSHFDNVHKFCKDELRISDAADISCLQETVTNIVETDSTKCTEYIKTLYKGATWDPDKLYHFKIVTSDIDYEDKSTFNLKLKFSGDMKHTFWKNKILPDVRVVVIDNEDYKDKVCYSHIDPHMKTVDGYHYEQQQEGNFILYYNQQYNIEVQETTKSCGGRATCACGVSVRAGKDVFMINRCGKTNFLGFSQCDDGGILQVVRNTDREYTVYTPIGTKVIIFLRWYGYMNIDIKMAPKDKYNVRGLCGNFDGDATNDLVHSNQKISALKTETVFYRRHHEEFANSWRVPEEKLYSRKKRALESWANLNGLFCVCQKGKQGISAEALCSSTQYLGCEMQKSITKTKCNIYSARKKRSPVAHEKEMDRLFALMQPVENHDVRKRQTNSNVISEVQAKERCSKKIKGSLAFTSYRDMTASEDPDAVISQCIFDIMATNDNSFADVHVDSVNTIVKGMMDEVPTYVETNKKVVQVFLKNSCSSNCSNRGNCSDDGECICHQYYHGAICDIDERIPPIVTDIEGGGICDTGEEDDCRCFYVRGDNFLDSLKCKIVTSEISISGEKIKVTVETLAGGFEDVFTGVCCIPDENVFSQDMFVREHDVSVSSDGVHYGDNNTMYIFDSTCQKLESLATGRPSFKLKNGFCFIEHACIKDTYAFLSNNDTCLSCNTSVSVTDWTETSLEICIPTTTTTSTETTQSYTSTTSTPTTTEAVENQTDPGITPTTHSMLTTSGMGSSKKRCKAKELFRLKQRKETLSLRNKKRKKKIQRLTEQIKRLKQLVKRVRNDRKKGNNQTTTQQP